MDGLWWDNLVPQTSDQRKCSMLTIWWGCLRILHHDFGQWEHLCIIINNDGHDLEGSYTYVQHCISNFPPAWHNNTMMTSKHRQNLNFDTMLQSFLKKRVVKKVAKMLRTQWRSQEWLFHHFGKILKHLHWSFVNLSYWDCQPSRSPFYQNAFLAFFLILSQATQAELHGRSYLSLLDGF